MGTKSLTQEEKRMAADGAHNFNALLATLRLQIRHTNHMATALLKLIGTTKHIRKRRIQKIDS